MAKIKKSIQPLHLSGYRVWIEDTDPNSQYFKLSQVPDVLTAGKNAFLINGSDQLIGEVLVEIIDSNGNAVFQYPVRNYAEGLARLVSIEVYSDTPAGLATLTILGRLTTDVDGNPPPLEFQNAYNVRWERQIQINPSAVNVTPIRLFKRPRIAVTERLTSYREMTDADETTVSTGSVQVSRYQIAPGIDSSLLTQVSVQGTPFTLNRDMIDGTFQASLNGTAFTASIADVISSKFMVLSESFAGFTAAKPAITTSDFQIRYTPSASFATTILSRSFADVTLSQLTTFAGDIQRARIYCKSVDQRTEYQVVGDIRLEATELTLTGSVATGDMHIRTGYVQDDAMVSEYWEVGNVVNYRFLTDGAAGLHYSSTQLLDAVHINSSSVFVASTTPRLFFGFKKKFEFEAGLEYTVDAKVVCNKASDLTNARMDVYLSGSAFPDTAESPLGVRLASLEVPVGQSYRRFGEISYNAIARADGSAKLYFVIYSGDWHVSAVSLSSARESGFNPDSVNVILPILGRRLENLQFKAELLDVNSNVVPVDIESDTVFFDGGNFVVKGEDNKVAGKLTIGTTEGGITITNLGYTGSEGEAVHNFPAIYIGRGAYSSSDTPFFAASGSHASGSALFSLGDRFLWDGENLTIVGSIRQRLPSQGGQIATDYFSRGDWQSGVLYYVHDLVQYSGSTYDVIVQHTSTPLSNPLNSSSFFQTFSAGGTSGLDASLITVKATGQIFTYDADNVTPSPSSQLISFTASLQNSNESIVWSTSPTTNFGHSGSFASMSVANFGVNTAVTVTATAGDISDAITIYRIHAGTTGSDAYIGFLTNESHTLPASSTGTVLDFSGAATIFKAFAGLTDVTSLYTITKNDVFTTSSISGNGTAAPTVTLTGINSGSDVGYIDITGSYSGHPTITKRFSLGKSKAGSSGSDAALISIIAEGQLFTFDADGTANPASQSLGFTASMQNIETDPVWSTSPTVNFGHSASVASMSIADFGSNTSVRITATGEGKSDSVTLYRITSGQSGSSAYTALLTNEAQLLPASSSGEVSNYSGAATAFKVYQGTTDVTNLYTIAKTDLFVTSSISGNGTDTPTVTVTGINSGSDVGFVDITGSATSRPTLSKRFTLAKSKAGFDAKTVRVSSTGQMFTFDATGSASPSSQTLSFTASLQNLTGSAVWSTSPTVGLGNNGNFASMSVASFGSNTSVAVTATVGSFSDTITIYRVTDGQSGSAGYVGFLTNEAQVLPANSSGVVSSFSGANTIFKVFHGLTDVTSFYTISRVNVFTTSSISGNGTASPTVTLTGINSGSDFGYVDITGSATNRPTIAKRFSVTKSKQGIAGADGSDGADGEDGPGIVYRGPFNSSTAYYKTTIRRDVVDSGGTYYITLNSAKSGLTTWSTPPNATDWEVFGAEFSSVATDILLAQDATITKGLVMGGAAGNVGFIRSVSGSDNGGIGFYGDGTGSFFIGSGSVSGNSGNYISYKSGTFKLRSTQFFLSASNFLIDSTSPGKLRLGAASAYMTGKGIYMDGNGVFRAGDPSNGYLAFSGSTLTLNSLDNVTDGSDFGKTRTDSILSGSLGIPMSSVIIDSFAGQFPGNNWTVKSSITGYTASVTESVSASYGGKVLRADKFQWWEGNHLIPFDPNQLYVIQIRVRCTRGDSGGGTSKNLLYAGIAGIAQDGVTYVNISGVNSFGSQHYFAASGIPMAVSSSWTTVTGYFQGSGSSPGQQHNDPNNPGHVHPDVKFFRPLFIVNYNLGDGQTEVDYVMYPNPSGVGIHVLASETDRQVNILSVGDGVLRYNTRIESGDGGFSSGNTVRMIRGLQSNVVSQQSCRDGVTVNFPIAFQSSPFVWVAGGLATEPRTANWTGGTPNPTGSGTYDRSVAADITTSGFTPILRLEQKQGTLTDRSTSFPAGSISLGDTSGAATFPSTTPAYNNTYTVEIDATFHFFLKFPGDSVTATITLEIFVDTGGGYDSVKEISIDGSYGDADSGNQTVNVNNQKFSFTKTGVGNTDKIKIQFTDFSFSGSPNSTASATVDPDTVTWKTISGTVIYASKTPDADDSGYYFALLYGV